jgi:hypothetical protein
MANEPKDQRIPIMMSLPEVQAIDDWGFENRIRTRASSVRTLIQLGLIYEPASAALDNALKTIVALCNNSDPRASMANLVNDLRKLDSQMLNTYKVYGELPVIHEIRASIIESILRRMGEMQDTRWDHHD